MSPEQVRQAQDDGLEIGAHTRMHPRLVEIDDEDALREEVRGSREDLEALLGRPVSAFAYPYGLADERATAAVEEAGFEIALTVENRRATLVDDPMVMPRIEICGTDSPLRFLRKLWFGGEP
jgi:peptidoglycan/xylan/chitin deacetylase (PgdA/CDA1 family)